MFMPTVYDNGLFDDFFGFPFFDREMKNMEKKLYGHRAGQLMKTDVREKDDHYDLEMDLPGFSKDEIQVSLKDGYMTIRAEKGLDEDRDAKNGRFLCRERYAGVCERNFYVGSAVTEDDIKGSFRHGVLSLQIPKKTEQPAIDERKYIAIED